MSYTHFVLAHLRKDLQIEWRAKDSINGMLFFSLLVVVVLAMAFDPGDEEEVGEGFADEEAGCGRGG